MELSGVTGSPCTVQDITHRDRAAILLLNANLLGLHLSFSHPDYTVGSGITPDQPSANGRQVTDFASSAGQIGPYTSCITAGRELHPALKDCFRYYLDVSTLMPKNQLFFVPFCHILTFNKLRNNKNRFLSGGTVFAWRHILTSIVSFYISGKHQLAICFNSLAL